MFIVDAGSGIAPLGAALAGGGPPEIDVLLSHVHLDHVTGLPFFKPALMPGRVVHTHCGNLGGASAQKSLDRLFSPPLFPVGLEGLPGRFEHHGFRAGEELRFADGTSVATIPLDHPGGATGYRFAHGGRVVCYVSDVEHGETWPAPDLVRFIEGADLVIFDGMFNEAEYPRCRGWGHSTWEKGVELCRAAQTKGLAIFHLHPFHDDAFLRRMEEEMRGLMPDAFVAREGTLLRFPPRS
jgi:phosphoribosyl 1,2-cyclic phosphodiesterase